MDIPGKTKKIYPIMVSKGHTVPIPKDGCVTTTPILAHHLLKCTYKLMTAVMTELLYKHDMKNETLPHEQRALVWGKRSYIGRCPAY